MERIQIDRTKSLRASRRKARAAADLAPLHFRACGNPPGDDDVVARIDALLHDQRRHAGGRPPES